MGNDHTIDNEVYFDCIQNAAEYVLNRTADQPQIGIVLGTGLGSFASQIENPVLIPYSEIPYFPQSTVQGHKGNLICGQIGKMHILAMQGRFHYYEGYSMKEVTFPIRVMQAIGIDTVIMSNAAGGVNEKYFAGDIVFITDHISLHHDNPLRGKNDTRLGTRFPDMFSTYSEELISLAEDIARKKDIKTHRGVYFGWPGPNLETPAEYNMINVLGGDVVGMSTVPEVLVAKHAGMTIFVVSVVTNECFPIGRIKPTGHEDVMDVAQHTEPKLSFIISEMIKKISAQGH